MSKAYYNEIDKYAAVWLRNLIFHGLIADGDVDERSIEDVKPSDLTGYTQCHFFAGIGVWSLALRNAGWRDDEPVWTGSCPCQPFSAAGKRGGTADERHLWPAWFWLISQCRPTVVFGEQVASKDGRNWLDVVQTDLEGVGLAVGAGDICAAGVGAPHIRQRLYFVGDATEQSRERRAGGISRAQAPPDGARLGVDGRVPVGLGDASESLCAVADAQRATWSRAERWSDKGLHTRGCGETHVLADTPRIRFDRSRNAGTSRRGEHPDSRILGNSDDEGSQGHGRFVTVDGSERRESSERHECANSVRHMDDTAGSRRSETGAGQQEQQEGWRSRLELGRSESFWSACDWLPCIDGKARPVEPGTFPLAHGVTGRVGRLRAYGNAIVAPCAEAFIMAYRESRE